MNPFRRPSTHYGKAPVPETPYQRAAQVWDERIGSARVQARNWRLMSFGSLALSGGLAAALVWQSSNGSIVPWVVQVDKMGEVQAVGPATADYRPTDPQIAWHLSRFIEEVRGIPADPIVLRQNWLDAYDFTSESGARALNEYARANDPFAQVGRVQVSVEISSVIRASPPGRTRMSGRTVTMPRLAALAFPASPPRAPVRTPHHNRQRGRAFRGGRPRLRQKERVLGHVHRLHHPTHHPHPQPGQERLNFCFPVPVPATEYELRLHAPPAPTSGVAAVVLPAAGSGSREAPRESVPDGAFDCTVARVSGRYRGAKDAAAWKAAKDGRPA